MKVWLLSCLCFVYTLPAYAGVGKVVNDTIKKRKIEYDFVKYSYNAPNAKGNETTHNKSRAYYFFEGDSIDKDLTASNLLKDFQHDKAMRKKIRQARRAHVWTKVLLLGILAIPLGLFGTALSKNWKVGKWVFGFVGLQALGLLAPAIFSGDKTYLMHVIDLYNQEIDKARAGK